MCFEKDLGKARVGIGAITVANGCDIVGDMAVQEGGVVTTEEDSITMTSPIEGEGARWTEICTVDGDMSTMAREKNDGVVETGGAGRSSS